MQKETKCGEMERGETDVTEIKAILCEDCPCYSDNCNLGYETMLCCLHKGNVCK